MFFFFQAEDGIRDGRVTGVQTCALPISRAASRPYMLLRLRSLQGMEAETSVAIASAIEQAAGRRAGPCNGWANWAAGVLCNGLARYAEAAPARRQATSDTHDPWMSMWAPPATISRGWRPAAGRCSATPRPPR